MSHPWCEPLTAIATFVAAGAAIWATFISSKGLAAQNKIAKIEHDRALLALGLEVLLQQDREFNGQKIVNCRKKAAVALLAGHPVGLSDVDDVLDFFDQVGFLLRRGAIDPEMAWHSFFCWVNRYWLASEDYIHRKQTEDKNVWADFSLLRSRLLEVELAKDPQSREAQLTSQSPQINEFFKDEAKTIPMKDWV